MKYLSQNSHIECATCISRVYYRLKYILLLCSDFLKSDFNDIGPAPNNFLQDLLKLYRIGIYKILKFKRNR